MGTVLKRACVVTAVLASLLLGYGYQRYYDVIHVKPATFAKVQDLVLPHLQVLLPDTDGASPAVLMFHGCGGVKPSLQRRARELVALGYAAIIVDSFTGRGLDWEKVCDGRALFGDQRAADVLVAIEYARNHARIAPDELFLAGYSHGGWAVLESITYNGALPRGLEDSPDEPLAGVLGAIAWYPYCGVATHFRAGWESALPVLMLLAAEDEITPSEPCVEIAKRQAAAGKPVEWRVFEHVSHGFDTGEEWVEQTDAGALDAANGLQAEFLRRHSR